PPNVYFVFDASGSMSAQVGGGFTRYRVVTQSAILLLQKLGSLINVGAAVFPHGATEEQPCKPGAQVFPMTAGDAPAAPSRPTLLGFSKALDITPNGGTPTAATLAALQPTITALGGKTIVLIATDGGPNCNGAASCGPDQCIANIEQACSVSNCC